MLGLPYNYLAGENLMQNTLSSGLEDYIETIYIASERGETLKGAELARRMNISRASVSEALSKLVSKGLIKYNSYQAIFLTETGKAEARRVYAKHHILKDFFENVLNVNPEEAGENACKIEHIISQSVLDKMEKFSEFFIKHKKILEIYMEESKK